MEAKIRYLKPEEKEKARTLWSQAFFEDSEEFDQYYFTEKIKENQILVKEDHGTIISLVHLNPYQIHMREHCRQIDYIVGVATDRERRHQGHMRDLLCRMLQDGWTRKEPFTFLMPADRAIYEPFDFRFIFDKPQNQRKTAEGAGWNAVWKTALELAEQDGELETIADFMEKWLSKRFQVYTVRDRAYVKNLMTELASEDGQIGLYCEDGQLKGIEAVWGLEEKEQRLLYFPDEWMETAAPPKPAIMGRIVNVQEFLQLFSLKSGREQEIEGILEVTDPLISQNNGLWSWNLTQNGSKCQKIQKNSVKSKQKIVCSVEQLIRWLMGYEEPEKIFAGENHLPDWHSQIRIFQGVFLDEEV